MHKATTVPQSLLHCGRIRMLPGLYQACFVKTVPNLGSEKGSGQKGESKESKYGSRFYDPF